MKTIHTVFFKEITENFRDRRTLLTALLMGPLFGPILFAFVINLSVKQSLSNESEALDLPVVALRRTLLPSCKAATSTSWMARPRVQRRSRR
ncbi:MAG: hypothetical protein IIC61_09975 [Proteobacteria bacterium]|nr:hypothetical protein [Pseudomonadota bacterium]